MFLIGDIVNYKNLEKEVTSTLKITIIDIDDTYPENIEYEISITTSSGIFDRRWVAAESLKYVRSQ